MVKWSDEEVNLVRSIYALGGVRGLKISGLKKTPIDIVAKAIDLGFDVTMDNVKLPTKEDYAICIKKGYIIPNGWTKEEIDIVLKYFSVGGYVLCKKRGLTKSNYCIKKLVTYISLKYYREKWWYGIKVLDLLDTYDKYGLKKCYKKFPNVNEDMIKQKIKQYRGEYVGKK